MYSKLTTVYLGGVKRQQHRLAGDEEHLQCIVLEHVPAPMYLHHLRVLPRQHRRLLVRREDLGDVGVPYGTISHKVAALVG